MNRITKLALLCATTTVVACDPFWSVTSAVPVRGTVDTACVQTEVARWAPSGQARPSSALDSAGHIRGTQFTTGTVLIFYVVPYEDGTTLLQASAGSVPPPSEDSLKIVERAVTDLVTTVAGRCAPGRTIGSPTLRRQVAR